MAGFAAIGLRVSICVCSVGSYKHKARQSQRGCVGGLQLACVVFSCGDGSESGQRRVTSTQSFKKTIACTRGTPEQFLATGGSKDIYVEIFGKDASLPYE